MMAGVTPSKIITAKYPDAPACPTDEYSVAIRKNTMERVIKNSVDMGYFALYLRTMKITTVEHIQDMSDGIPIKSIVQIKYSLLPVNKKYKK